MITSKKDLKKHMDRINTEVAQGILPAAVCANIIDEAQAADILTKLAELTTKAHACLSISFDKSPKAFDSASAYKRARHAYFKTAYATALKDFEEGVNNLLQGIKAEK